MKVAVASSDFAKVAGHAGRARKWLVYEVGEDGSFTPPQRIELEAGNVFHYAEDGRPHPLDGIDALIANSAGDGFLKNMEKRGIRPILTAESNPDKAVRDLLAESLSPPKPRPIGALICKTIDLFGKHK
ncbi:MAG TPA: NifB/NifX family molybdenum-iron cluster-binding protein [Magnetospirillum sp.]|jgi:predicted Fe-Mo cluster-binding NifX family protein|nr:NifB/NifX family molybdenum-iron cluster-binding protein [Magnetospirillum sp.]